jgi:hypothetical protein
MNYATAKTAKKTADKTANTTVNRTWQKTGQSAAPTDHGTALDRCYGQIGISAVAAAARYQGGGKNPAYAPVVNRWDDRTGEAA